ncbi:hypothetical protein CsSME_00018853 [Camellia sinensis var. sinensis]
MSSLSFGYFSSVKITGAVRFSFAKSLLAGFLSCSTDCVKSKMSSTTWKDSPRFLPCRFICSLISLSTPLKMEAPLVLAVIKEAVL